MGPVRDRLGVEQGGCNSDRLYKLANNKELIITQLSGLGLHLRDVHCASVGQSDDVALLSDNIHHLQCILQLAVDYAIECHNEIGSCSALHHVAKHVTPSSIGRLSCSSQGGV